MFDLMVQVSVEKKSQDNQKVMGAAMVQLIDGAAAPQLATPAAPVASPDGRGSRVHVAA